MQRVADAGGVLFVDDSKGTTVTATRAALAGLGRPVVLIAGGDGKGQDFTPLMEAIDAHCRAVLLIGRDAPAIGRALAGTAAMVEHAGTLETAVARAMQLAKPGDAVVLSPACASLDQFANYIERGERLRAARPDAPRRRMRMPRDDGATGTLRPFGVLKAWSSLGALPRNPRTMLDLRRVADVDGDPAARDRARDGVLGIDRDGRGLRARRLPLLVLPGAPRDVHRASARSRRSSLSRYR